ncbi:hypothetical protein EMPS_10762 [Entomortierella parvispora]|uniref:G domain-containing protein n=1 Tax=Entomortierella parvispora TaxID=205924 RepID=A0A9P3HKY1_9FUNG|nr:hypothetical protein EMPS_10762 [Entomortierella parvispora]
MTQTALTKIIIVMGITGAGKSYLIKEISGQNVKVGTSLKSCTQHIESVQCVIDDKPVLILDTPGFDDTHRSDTEVLTEIADHLANLYRSGFQVCGIIYLHNIREDRVRGSSYKNLKMFEKLCGAGALQNVVMLTNRWAMINEADGERKEEELKREYWGLYVAAGCTVDRYRTRDDLVRIFRELLCNNPSVLEIQHDMVDMNKPLCETAAGEVVNAELAEQQRKHREQLAEIAADYDKKNFLMKRTLDQERNKLEASLQQLEADRVRMMTEAQRAEEAAKAGMEKTYQECAERERRLQEEFQEKMRRAEEEKNAAAQELAKLAAIRQHEEKMVREREHQRSRCCML